MRVYVVVIKDRHAEPDMLVFADIGQASFIARTRAGSDATEVRLTDSMLKAGWRLLLRVSDESEWVSVVERELVSG